ncbi:MULTISPECIES: tyrosine-type recombinase/integrase [unclassified Acinetobacter]|uniref:tyrosine-type recombinase/integrase n=7 Tax=Acinetobacter TaxID=469 RepID=UPI0015D37FB4|nr:MULTISPECIES: tyrosine-type recombinase/integrase [unclassified Acinetobacter]
MSQLITINESSSQLATINALSPDLYFNFISFLDVKEKTADTYRKALKRLFQYFADNQITQPTRSDLIAFRDELKEVSKASTVKTYLTATRLFFRWLEQEGLYKNIADKIKGAKVEHGHKKDALTVDQVKDVIDTFTADTEASTAKRDYAIFCLMVTCGLRTIEVVRADLEDLRTLGSKTVLYVQGKGKDEKSEYVIITREVEKAIRSYLATRKDTAAKAPLFTSTSNNSKGQRLTTRTISGIVKERLKLAGLNSNRLTAHSLRHTAVTLSLLGGSTLQEARQFARHSNIATTEIYAHNLERIANPCEGIVSSSIFKNSSL